MIIKGIGFDYGGVIAGISGSNFDKQVCRILDVTSTQHHESYFKFNHLANEKGLSWDEVWRMVVKDMGRGNKYDELMDFINGLDKNDVNTDIIDLVDRLRAKDYRVGVLSNNTKEQAAIIRANAIDTHFDTFLISEEIGVSKPKPEAFELLFKGLDAKPEETVFIDDAKNSLRTANEIGYKPIFYTDFNKLLRDLDKLGIRI